MANISQSGRTAEGQGNSKRRAQGKRRPGQGRGGSANASDSAIRQPEAAVTIKISDPELARGDSAAAAEEETQEEDVCWICAEKIRYHSLPECNHNTCHVCGLRLRALYKKLECTFCKAPQPIVIFTETLDRPFQEYDLESMKFYDEKLAIRFETQEIMEESVILLRFNCPDQDCDYIGGSWADLKWHVRDRHGRLMCDICIKYKKIFAHEHVTYTPKQLPWHLPSMRRDGHGHVGKHKEKEVDSHPMCEFCRDCFYGEDELYSHLRERHEDCFICKKRGIVNQYFLNWEKLEQHFRQDHFPCKDPSCQEKKFIVFASQMDMQAHMVDEHGDSMTAKDKNRARRIEVPFTFTHSQPGRGVDGAHPNRARAGGGAPIGNAQPESSSPRVPAQSSSAADGPNGRVAPVSSRRANFGSQLTSGDGAPIRIFGSSGDAPDNDEDVVQQHTAFMEYVQSLVSTPNGLAAIRAAIKSWQSSESTAYDMLDTIFNVLNRDKDKSSKVISRLVDLLEGERRDELVEAWGGMKAEASRDTPTLRALAPGGMDYAGISSGRVINVKHATRGRTSNARTPIWDRVEQAASSSSRVPFGNATSTIQPRLVPGAAGPPASANRFPALPTSAARPAPSPPIWKGGSGPSSSPVPRPPSVPVIRSVNVSSSRAKGRGNDGPNLSASAFPVLPSVKDDLPTNFITAQPKWQTPAPANSWGSSKPNNRSTTGGNPQPSSSSSKSGKKRGKETLFTLGGLPT